MKSLRVHYDETSGTVEKSEDALPEAWNEVCDRFDNDVSRVKAVADGEGYTALYVCYDENNRPSYYLVEEDESLATMRRQTFLEKLGVKKG